MSLKVRNFFEVGRFLSDDIQKILSIVFNLLYIKDYFFISTMDLLQ